MNDVLVTEADLARARRDPAFRQQLVAANLELLIEELNKLRSAETNAKHARQIREGGHLAVQLAELLQRLGGTPASAERRCSCAATKLAFSTKLRITRPSARPWPGAEQTTVTFPGTHCFPWHVAAGPDGPASGVSAF